MEKNITTREGYEKSLEKLDYLKKVKKAEITEQIKIALSYGDLSENSEYDEAKNAQAFLEAEIANLENFIKTAVIVDSSSNIGSGITLGNKITIKKVDSGEIFTFKLVGNNELSPLEMYISVLSPIGEQLLTKNEGDIITTKQTPMGFLTYEILKVEK